VRVRLNEPPDAEDAEQCSNATDRTARSEFRVLRHAARAVQEQHCGAFAGTVELDRDASTCPNRRRSGPHHHWKSSPSFDRLTRFWSVSRFGAGIVGERARPHGIGRGLRSVGASWDETESLSVPRRERLSMKSFQYGPDWYREEADRVRRKAVVVSHDLQLCCIYLDLAREYEGLAAVLEPQKSANLYLGNPPSRLAVL
jgi:hypothetical protein